MSRLAHALAGGAVLLLAACGVPRDDRPQLADRDDVPFELLAPTVSLPESTTTTVRDTRPMEVFFVRDARLVGVERRFPAPVTVTAVLDALLDGPTPTEAGGGLRSALSPQIAGSVDVVRGVARISLNPTFTEAPSEEQALALAQLVYTATSLPGVGAATFLLGDTPVEVPRPDGSLSATVTREDFTALLADG